jgi:hypothetical protein
VIDLPTSKIFIDGIYLWVVFKDNIDMSIDDAINHEQSIYKLAQGKKYLIMLDGRAHMATFSPEARKYMAESPLVNEVRVAQAIIVSSLAGRLIANFYIKFNKPPRPVRVFNDEASAKKWLKQFESQLVNSSKVPSL